METPKFSKAALILAAGLTAAGCAKEPQPEIPTDESIQRKVEACLARRSICESCDNPAQLIHVALISCHLPPKDLKLVDVFTGKVEEESQTVEEVAKRVVHTLCYGIEPKKP